MPRFFGAELRDGQAVLRGEEAAHIARSLRMRAGEPLTLCDGEGTDYICVIESVCPEEIRLKIISAAPSVSEPAARVTLFQCVPKGDKLERIVKQSVELGASEIVPVVSERCVSRPEGKAAAAKRGRLEKIALEAAKQSGRGRLPRVGDFLAFDEIPARLAAFDAVLFFYEAGGAPLRRLLAEPGGIRTVAAIVGSEGGFSPREAEQIQSAGGRAVTLGPRILRAETAPVAALAALMLLMGNLE